MDYQVIHTTPGRLRIRIPLLATTPEYAGSLQAAVESLNFVTSVRINPAASSVVVQYDTVATSLAEAQSALIAAIEQVLSANISSPTEQQTSSSRDSNELKQLELSPPEKSSDDEQIVVHQTNVAQRRACLIFNPIAGQSNPQQDLENIRSILESELTLDIRTTTPELDADQLAKEAIEQGCEMIIASGGDGTVSAVAAATVATEIPLGIIPRGTANAFANALGIPTNLEQACETILDGTVRVVDAADCNGTPMILLAGIGFEAETVSRADREYKNQFGTLAYVLAGLQELSELEPFSTQLETDDKIITVQAAAVTVANVAPATSVLAQGPQELVADDGLLDVTIVSPSDSLAAFGAAINLLQSALQGESVNRADTGYLRTKQIKIVTSPPQKVVLDGEVIGETPVEIKCLPGGLKVLVPTLPEPESPMENLEGLPNLQIKPK